MGFEMVWDGDVDVDVDVAGGDGLPSQTGPVGASFVRAQHDIPVRQRAPIGEDWP